MDSSSGYKKAIYMIYFSHFLSAWGDRMWDFAVGLYMVILYPDSLLLTAILGFVTAAAVISFGGPLGTWIDNTKRIRSATIAIVVQNVAVALGSTGLALIFAFRAEIQATWNGALEYFVYAMIILASVIANLASVISDIAIERDWIVVLANGNEKRLATMNAVMRTTDLTTKILAPIAIGGLIAYWSRIAGAVFIVVWNVVSGVVEILLLLKIYSSIPQLNCKTAPTNHETRQNVFKECWGGWRIYVRHPIKWAGIGFSCLYMTVLGFDQISIGYLYSQGVGEGMAAIITAMGAITGIIGSVSYPFLRRCIGSKSTFILGYLVNSFFLFLCVISVFLPGSPFVPSAILHPFDNVTSSLNHETLSLNQLWEQRQNIFCFIAGIVLARFGLWVADLSATQLLQDRVEETKRGVINGVQNSMNQTMDLFKFFLVILLPSAQTFGFLVIATWVFGCLGWTLHSVFLKQSQGNESESATTLKAEKSLPSSSYSLKRQTDESTPLLATK